MFFDKEMTHCSLAKFNDDFMTYTERFDFKYHLNGGYYSDDLKRVRAGKDTKTVNFKHLMEVLKSSDESLLKDNEWMFEGDSKFLDMSAEDNVDSMHNIVSYCSYPRMGNSFLRMYF